MRIVHFSTSDTAGGAARAAYRVHSGLKLLGHNSQMRVLKKWSIDPSVTKFIPATGLVDRFKAKLRERRINSDFDKYRPTRPPSADQYSDDRTPWGDQPLRDLPECDIVNFHWVAGYMDQSAFFDYFATKRPKTPLFWRMADMAPVTAGCHYDQGCGKFESQCGACPCLGSTQEVDLSRQQWQRRQAALSGIPDGRLHLVATSRWIRDQAKRSSLLRRFDSTVIPNALDTDIFRPRDKAFARDMLNLPQHAKIVLFAADSAKQPRKGWKELAAAVEGIDGVNDVVLASVGGGKPSIGGDKTLVNLGRIDDDRILSLAYSAADVYVIPSLQESFGQTVIESMACGTPIVGFASGGITDTVRPGVTGSLAATGSVSELRTAIVDLLKNDAKRRSLSEQCRQVALAEYALGVQAAQYERMYQARLDAR